MSFTPRTQAPDVLTNKYYRHTGYYDYYGQIEGLNECLLIDTFTGAVMPNCTGYAWGRFYEITGERPRLSRGDAYLWYNYPDNYQRSRLPQLGAVICFSGGNLGAGHVAIVESIAPNGDITCSNSAYGNPDLFWFPTTLTKSSGYSYYNYTFQGFIINPLYPPPIPTRSSKFKLIYATRSRRLK